jgi:hypothetical protein
MQVPALSSATSSSVFFLGEREEEVEEAEGAQKDGAGGCVPFLPIQEIRIIRG